MEIIICTSCKADIHPYAVFPNDLCLSCYEQTPEANAPLTEAGLAQLTRTWGGK